MAYTDIPSGDKDPDSPLDTTLINLLDNNVDGVAAGDAGAPNVVYAALSLSNDLVQGDINVGTSSNTAITGNITLSGGQFSFYPQTGSDGYQVGLGLCNTSAGYGTYVGRITGSSGTGRARNTYWNASPPFNIGHGDIGVFAWARINNNTGEKDLIQVSQAPPWAYNGPTSLRHNRVDKRTGKKYKNVIKRTYTFNEANKDPEKMEVYLYEMQNPEIVEIEIDHSVKNADMGLFPHPHGANDNTGYTIVTLDPFCQCAQILQNLIELNDDSAMDEIDEIMEHWIKFDNNSLDAGFHGSVMCVKGRLK